MKNVWFRTQIMVIEGNRGKWRVILIMYWEIPLIQFQIRNQVVCVYTYSWLRQSHVVAACDLTQLWRRALTSIYNWIRGSYCTWQRPCVGKLHCQQPRQEFQLVKFAEYEVQPRKPPKIRRSVLSTGDTKYPLSVGFWNTAVYRSSAPLWLMEEGLPSFFYLTLYKNLILNGMRW